MAFHERADGTRVYWSDAQHEFSIDIRSTANALLKITSTTWRPRCSCGWRASESDAWTYLAACEAWQEHRRVWAAIEVMS